MDAARDGTLPFMSESMRYEPPTDTDGRSDTFDVGHWHAKCITTLGAYNVLVSLAETPGALEALKQSRRVIGLDGELNDAERESAEVKALLDAYCSEVGRAVEHYASMMIVAGATIIENMLMEYFVACFYAKPKAMYIYLQAADGRGAAMSLNEVLAATDIRELHGRMALRAAKQATNGSTKKILSRAGALTNYAIPASMIKSVESVVTRRNKVVHDAVTYFREDDGVAEVFDVTLDLLKHLAASCRYGDIPYQDPGYLIDDYPLPEGLA